MYARPESFRGARITAKDDERITPTGRWLRDTKLNELPQLWNVLVGEMSLVGPRPEDPEFAKTWPADLREEILSVRPGITSPASISYRDEEKRLSSDNLIGDYLNKIAPDKLRLDSLYVRHHTLLTDLDTIFWTHHRAAAAPGEDQSAGKLAVRRADLALPAPLPELVCDRLPAGAGQYFLCRPGLAGRRAARHRLAAGHFPGSWPGLCAEFLQRRCWVSRLCPGTARPQKIPSS